MVSGEIRHRLLCCFLDRNHCNLTICNVISLQLLVRAIPFTQTLSCTLLANSSVSHFQRVRIPRKGAAWKPVWVAQMIRHERGPGLGPSALAIRGS